MNVGQNKFTLLVLVIALLALFKDRLPQTLPSLPELTNKLLSQTKPTSAIPSYKDVPEMTDILGSDQTKRLTAARKLVERVDVDMALEILERSPLPHTGEGHLAIHQIGFYAYQKYGLESILKCKDYFLFGCYHGALEQYLKDHDLATAFTSLCNQVKDSSTPLVYNECFHGLGHAAMFVTESELPQSLALCDTLPDQNAQERCYSGAFMENSSSSTNLDHPSKYIKADDPLYPCNSLDEKYQQLCYRYQSSHFALLTRQNWPATANLCLKVPQKYQPDCFRTIGTNQVGFTQDFNVMTQNCTSMPKPEFQEICITGVVASLSYRFVNEPQKMIDFCSQVPSGYQEVCFRQMGLGLKDWSTNPANSTNLCSLIQNQQYSSWCQQTAT